MNRRTLYKLLAMVPFVGRRRPRFKSTDILIFDPGIPGVRIYDPRRDNPLNR